MTSPKNKSPELKPCPACGGTKIIMDWLSKGSTDTQYNVFYCEKCEFQSSESSDLPKAIEAWNNQPRIDKLEKQLKEMAELVEKTWKDALLSTKMRHSLGGDLSWTQSPKYELLQQILEVEK